LFAVALGGGIASISVETSQEKRDSSTWFRNLSRDPIRRAQLGSSNSISERDRTASFQRELVEFLDTTPPVVDDGRHETRLAWQKTLQSGRWVAPHWPISVGGRDASPSEMAIYQTELARRRAPQIAGTVGVNNLGAALLAHGTTQQQRRYAPKILSGDEIWCQLFSEPQAGSDLTAIQTRAEPDGDQWVLTGSKIWVSHADVAHFGLCLVRTEPADTNHRHRGLTCMIVDLRSRGVTVRPMRDMTGGRHFARVMFDEVFLGADSVLGEVGEGWSVVSSVFSSERGGAYARKEELVLRSLLDDTISWSGIPGIIDDVTRIEILGTMNRAVLAAQTGSNAGPNASVVRLLLTDATQNLTQTRHLARGPAAIAGDPADWWHLLWYRMASIGGGTSEIQRNIVAERVLGLPREPRWVEDG
jgi:alkylation response protein AidB-like acyl-CoA dehydrogenase